MSDPARRDTEGGWSGNLGFTMFVARRYLMNAQRKVAPKVWLLIGVCVAINAALGWKYGLAAPWGASPKMDAIIAVRVLAGAGVLGGLVVGVLRHSRPAYYTFFAGVILAAAVGVALKIATHHDAPPAQLELEIVSQQAIPSWLATTMMVVGGLGGLFIYLALFFGTLRAFFTFFTTVPIGGVWLGTMALICVLSVMSGFETDLRDKILGSNAHINVTREDGDIDDWRAVKKRIDAVPGVVASTPYAQSEVVIANNNGTNVIIKGIDPKTVGKVTRLVSDITDEPTTADKEAAMARLEPLIADAHELDVQPRTATGPVIDPPPSDLPSGGDPIDFSKPAAPDFGSGALPPVPGSAGSAGSAASAAPAGSADANVPTGSAAPAVPAGSALPSILPPHHDRKEIIGSDVFGSDDAMRVPVDVSFDSPAMSRRTQSLPGILVGKELEKTMHLYEGEEVRVVSPLSDPSNPDATGTPIPFNRDYRVAGFFFTGMYEYDLKYVYVTLDSLQEFLDRGSSVDGVEVRTTDPDRTDEIVPRIAAALGPGYRVQDWKEINRGLFSALKLEKIAMFVVLGIVILVASFSIIGNLIMVVVEKGKEIALLKTLGASDTSVMQVFAIQGLLIGLIGTTLGVVFGLAICYLGKHFGIPLDPNVYYIDQMPIHVDGSSVVVTFLAGVVISIAATLYPALLAARIRPATGIRH